jgi:hypothetical protein
MAVVNQALVDERLDLADQLLTGRARMLEPQDLPGRYGRVVRAIDHVLQATQTEAVVGGGWAVWRHGFLGRLTQDIDIVVPLSRLEEFLRVAAVAAFSVVPRPEGLWPRLLHKETDITVDILPEGGRPGTPTRPAPTTIPPPAALGAGGWALRYMSLPSLVELKLAAGRARDESDVVELVRANPDRVEAVRQHLAGVHADYVRAFDNLIERAREQGED